MVVISGHIHGVSCCIWAKCHLGDMFGMADQTDISTQMWSLSKWDVQVFNDDSNMTLLGSMRCLDICSSVCVY